MITADWREHVAWRRAELQVELNRALEAAARAMLRSQPPRSFDYVRIRHVKAELAMLALVEAAALRIESEALW